MSCVNYTSKSLSCVNYSSKFNVPMEKIDEFLLPVRTLHSIRDQPVFPESSVAIINVSFSGIGGEEKLWWRMKTAQMEWRPQKQEAHRRQVTAALFSFSYFHPFLLASSPTLSSLFFSPPPL